MSENLEIPEDTPETPEYSPKRRGRPPKAQPAPQTVPCRNCGQPSTRVIAYENGPEIDACENDDCVREAYAAWIHETRNPEEAEFEESPAAVPVNGIELLPAEGEITLPVPRHPEIPPSPFGPYADQLGLQLPEDLSLEEWMAMGRGVLLPMGRAAMFWLGDFLNQGETRYGQEFAQLVDELGYSRSTAMNAKSCCARIPREERRASLTYTHHMEVYWLEKAERDAWLDRAEAQRLTVQQLRAAVRDAKVSGKSPISKAPAKKKIEKLVAEYATKINYFLGEMEEVLPFCKTVVDLAAEAKWDQEAFEQIYAHSLTLRDKLVEIVLDGSELKRIFEG